MQLRMQLSMQLSMLPRLACGICALAGLWRAGGSGGALAGLGSGGALAGGGAVRLMRSMLGACACFARRASHMQQVQSLSALNA